MGDRGNEGKRRVRRKQGFLVTLVGELSCSPTVLCSLKFMIWPGSPVVWPQLISCFSVLQEF